MNPLGRCESFVGWEACNQQRAVSVGALALGLRPVGQELLQSLPQRPELPFDVLGGTEDPHRLFSVESRRPWWRHGDRSPQGLKL